MVAPRTYNLAQLGLLQEDPTLGFDAALRAYGLDPDTSYLGQYARNLGKHLSAMYNFGPTFGQQNAIQQLPSMIDSFARAVMTPGANPFSQFQNISQQYFSAQPGTSQYAAVRTGDPEKDLAAARALQALENATRTPLYQSTAENLLRQQYRTLLSGLATGQINQNMTLADYLAGRQAAPAPYQPPPPGTTPPGTTPPGTTPPGTTPPGTTPPGTTPPGTTPPSSGPWQLPSGRPDIGVSVRWRSDGALGSDWQDRYALLGNVNRAPSDRTTAIIRLASRLSIHPALAKALIDSGVYDLLGIIDPTVVRNDEKLMQDTTDVWGRRGEVNKVPSWGWQEAARLVNLAQKLASARSIEEGLASLGIDPEKAREVAQRYRTLRGV
jgi:hypothetical protein